MIKLFGAEADAEAEAEAEADIWVKPCPYMSLAWLLISWS